MCKEILVSVIIPVYNMEKYLSRCLESVINQTYSNLEIIIVDDGSIDNSGEIIDEFIARDGRVSAIKKENGGSSSARNAGIEIASGEYLYFIDSDDYMELNGIEVMLETALTHDADIVTFESSTFSDSVSINADLYKRNLNDKAYSGHEFFSYCIREKVFHPNVWLCFYKKDIFANIHFIEGIVYEDTPFIFELMSDTISVFSISDILVYHRMEEGSIMRSKITNHKIMSNIVGVKHMVEVYLNDPGRTPEMAEFIQWCASTHYSAIRELEEYDVQAKELNREFRRYISTERWLISVPMIKEIIKLLIKHPNRLL